MEHYILVIDDEAGIRLLLTELFERSGVPVRAIGSGEEAVRIVQEEKAPFLVLLDMKMPGMDGLETLQRLRQAGLRAHCLLMTAVIGDQRVRHALDLGPVSILPKPFDVLALRNRVDAMAAVGG